MVVKFPDLGVSLYYNHEVPIDGGCTVPLWIVICRGRCLTLNVIESDAWNPKSNVCKIMQQDTDA